MAKLLKELYNKQYIDYLASNIVKNYKTFKTDSFKKAIFYKGWEDLELKQRMRHIASTLGEYLPSEYIKAIDILEKTFKDVDSKYALENMLFQDFVEVYGLDEFDTSMMALETFTVGSSSEFAIRQFILKYPKKTMTQMQKWAKSENEHVRRLASEGCRPRLPWAIALPEFKKDPSQVIKILDVLKDDESEYVRKSVANNLNDISKDNPEITINLAKKWIGNSKNTDKLLKHGCRTLLKASEVDALEIFGIKKAKHITLEAISIQKKVEMGSELEFSFTINSKKNLGYLRVEYQMEFLRQNNKYSKKMFKICEGEYLQNNKTIQKRHSFKPISTRKYYAGVHRLHLYVNGEIFKSFEFKLVTIT
ncbi:DNA alkylation repair protein [Sulfurimonas lithotrophica]|uniref:DNA alkylation repair protein n=1 Tax=Sulfurimonas lithotrophica TaxID=2590022 RepID=A0A5P8P0E6_9BACT|nr:DNA alkylation repair protein [Sulfurimonas lithotrophica]QFR49186.1 DNA alkylation repair protein [Sulfurimonas lithotrophica]